MTVISDLSLSELRDHYNGLAKQAGVPTISKFRDKATGQRRCQELEKQVKPKKKGERKKRGMRFVFPFNGREHLRSVRDEESLRGMCVDLLTAGATFDEVEKLVVEFDKRRKRDPQHIERRAYELVRIMHYYLGYGIAHDQSTGIIKLHTREVGAAS